MTQVHFILNSEEVQNIIEPSVKDDVSRNSLVTVFNQLMENKRTGYIQAPKTMDDQKAVKAKEMATISETLRLVSVHLN